MGNNKYILIVCAGQIDLEQLSEYVIGAEYIIAVDRGYDYLRKINVIPNILIGDLDSTNSKIIDLESEIDIKRFPPEKDFTDFELALEHTLNLECNYVYIMGATGFRLDHTLGNIEALKQIINYKKAFIIDIQNRLHLLNDNYIVNRDYKYFSILPYTDVVEGITIKGAKYSLDNFSLFKGRGIGISNEVKENSAEVSIKKGILILIESKDI